MDDTEILSPRLLRRHYGSLVLHEHWCPGCGGMHQIAVDTPFRNGARWSWDGNADRPTFGPSVFLDPGGSHPCHYFIRAGRIDFCQDSHHALAGKSVELPDIPKDWLD